MQIDRELPPYATLDFNRDCGFRAMESQMDDDCHDEDEADSEFSAYFSS